jgi:hypothetical protein
MSRLASLHGLSLAIWLLAAALSPFALPGCAVRSEAPPDATLGLDVLLPDAPMPGDSGPRRCTSDSECRDRIACTLDHCEDGTCQHDACVDCCPGTLACDESLGCTIPPEPCTTDADCRDDVRCTLDRCRDGMFCEHLPEAALCASGEVCLGGVGCIPEPPTSCTTDAECAGGSACAAVWRCEPEFGCSFVSPLDCDDADACTDDRCDEGAGGCVHDPVDRDGDGFVGEACGGDDCDDAADSVSPDADEICANGVDDDCSGGIDEGCCVAGLVCTTTCGSTGATACALDGTTTCVPPAEACNGVDDDCDGTRDEGCCAAGVACTTSCGSTGTTTCMPDGTPGPCVPPGETCNDADDDCDGTIDDGFACRVGTSMACTTSCGSTGSRACLPGCSLDGTCAPPAEVCNGVDDDCDASCDDGFTCCAGSARACSTFGFFSGTALCRGDCSGFDTSTCSNCGNGTRNAGEACDGVDLGGSSCTSLGMGFSSGTLRCAPGCVYDTSSCSRCGNGAIDAGEQCDGASLGGASCASLGMGFAGGTLRCGAGCAFDTSSCTRCGNGTIDGGEQCDGANLGGASCTTIPGGYSGGTLRCTPGCAFDSSSCTSPMPWDPSGVYAVTPAPSYTCALGIITIDMSTITFSDGGTLLVASGGGLNCSPSGASPRGSPTRSFSLSCTLPGTCAETYAITGTFTDDTHWTGTVSATFVGGASCLGCVNRSWSVSGAR